MASHQNDGDNGQQPGWQEQPGDQAGGQNLGQIQDNADTEIDDVEEEAGPLSLDRIRRRRRRREPHLILGPLRPNDKDDAQKQAILTARRKLRVLSHHRDWETDRALLYDGPHPPGMPPNFDPDHLFGSFSDILFELKEHADNNWSPDVLSRLERRITHPSFLDKPFPSHQNVCLISNEPVL